MDERGASTAGCSHGETFERLLKFLNRLDERHVHYRLGHTRPESVMIEVPLPGRRWEIEWAASRAWPRTCRLPSRTVTGRVIAAWPSFALIGSYELLMQQIRATATSLSSERPVARSSPARTADLAPPSAAQARTGTRRAAGSGLRDEALRWAMANRSVDGRLPSGRAIADQFGRHERWGRLVKHHMVGADPGA
jgi:hypothetical protein